MTRLPTFIVLALLTFKHWLFERFSTKKSRSRRSRRREHIYVDASFHVGATPDQPGVGGIGVWIPRRRIAIALKVDARTSMEAETLALLAGAIAAKRLGLQRPIIFSDCKSAVKTATEHLAISRSRGFMMTLVRLAELSSEHRAFRHIFDALRSMRGTLEWQPRENNREADLASNIGSRVGNMGILLSSEKNRNHALNDVLSLALDPDAGTEEAVVSDLVHRSYRCGTRTVSLATRRQTTPKRFLRDAHGLIARLSAEVA